MEINQSVLLHALGWTLIHSVWEIALLGMLAAIARKMVGKTRPELSYNLTLFLTLAILPVFMITFLKVHQLQEAQFLNLPGNGQTTPQPLSGYTVSRHISALISLREVLDRYSIMAPLLWIPGVFILTLKNSSSYYLLRKLKIRAVEVTGTWSRKFQDLVSNMGIRRRVGLRTHPQVKVPFVTGLIKPMLIVPVAFFSGYAPDEIEAILVHELMHIRRMDPLTKQVVLWIKTLFFFHPLLWVMDRWLETDRENSCDRQAVLHLKNPLRYAKTLLSLSEGLPAPQPATAVVGKKKLLYHRIIWIMEKMNEKNRYKPAGLYMVMIAALFMWFAIQGRAVVRPGTVDPGNVTESYSIADKNPWTADVRKPGILKNQLRVPNEQQIGNTAVGRSDQKTDHGSTGLKVSPDRKNEPEPETVEALKPGLEQVPAQLLTMNPERFFAMQDTLHRQYPFVDAMTWEEIRRAQMEAMKGLEEALRLAQDSLRVFNREAAEAMRREMEQAREAYRESIEHLHSEEFRQQMEEMRDRIENYRFPEDSIRRAVRKQMDTFREINWDSIYHQMEQARIKMEKHFRQNAKQEHQSMEQWQQKMEEALQQHQESLRKQEEILEELEKEMDNKSEEKQKKNHKVTL